MEYDRSAARRAGFFYCAAAVFYIFGMMYVEGRVSVPGDPVGTLRNISGMGLLYKSGLLSTLLGHVCLLFVAEALYSLFSRTDPSWARLLVIFVLVGVSIAFLNRAHQVVVLGLATSAYQGIPDTQRLGLGTLFHDLFLSGERLAGIFWGLWLLPAGILALKSKFAPRALGLILIVASALYLVSFLEYFFMNPVPTSLAAALRVVHLVDTIAKVASELGFIGWLLYAGLRVQPRDPSLGIERGHAGSTT